MKFRSSYRRARSCLLEDFLKIDEMNITSGSVVSATLERWWVGYHNAPPYCTGHFVQHGLEFSGIDKWETTRLEASPDGSCRIFQDWHPCSGPRPCSWEGVCTEDDDGTAITIKWLSMTLYPHEHGYYGDEEIKHFFVEPTRTGFEGLDGSDTLFPPARYTRVGEGLIPVDSWEVEVAWEVAQDEIASAIEKEADKTEKLVAKRIRGEGRFTRIASLTNCSKGLSRVLCRNEHKKRQMADFRAKQAARRTRTVIRSKERYSKFVWEQRLDLSCTTRQP